MCLLKHKKVKKMKLLYFHGNDYALCSWLVMIMKFSERRGHSKLRLCSQKYFKSWQRKKWSSPNSFPISIPLKNISVFKVSLPLNLVCSAYIDVPQDCLDILHKRLRNCNVIPSGMYLIFIL